MITDTVALLSNPTQLTDVPVGWATLALAVATAILAFLNWLMIRQMKEARKASERPGLYLWSVPAYIDDKDYQLVQLNVQNGGKGAVEAARVECWLKNQASQHVYLTYESAVSFAPGETRGIDCFRREQSHNAPKDGYLVVRLRWRGAKPWWDAWQQSESYVLDIEEMKKHGTKFQSLHKISVLTNFQ